LAAVMACVINGDTMTGVLRQATWLVVAVTVLIVVETIAMRLPQQPVKPVVQPDTNG